MRWTVLFTLPRRAPPHGCRRRRLSCRRCPIAVRMLRYGRECRLLGGVGRFATVAGEVAGEAEVDARGDALSLAAAERAQVGEQLAVVADPDEPAPRPREADGEGAAASELRESFRGAGG